VLYSLVHWGEDALLMFNGMFAIAFWDNHAKTLLLSRDRYGIKPLYVMSQKKYFAFSSEYKAFDALPEFKKTVNVSALRQYFTFQNIFNNDTLLQDVQLIPPGHYVSITRDQMDSGKFSFTKYWDFEFKTNDNLYANQNEALCKLDSLASQAVNRQLMSDVPVGAYLSGGLDSGLITKIASKSMPSLVSFTCGFDLSSISGIEVAYDERHLAEAISASCATTHYEVILKAGDIERSIEALSWHLEDPRVGQSYPNFYVSELASKFTKVVLSGTGGDELFAGYPWRYHISEEKSKEKYLDQYFTRWQRLLPEKDVDQLLNPCFSKLKNPHVTPRSVFFDIFNGLPNVLETPTDQVNASLYFEAKTFLPGLLMVEDKLSMAHSLESRVPLLDNDLVDFSLELPLEYKLSLDFSPISIDENDPSRKKDKYYNSTNNGKYLMRELANSYLSSEIAQAKKQGFSAPDASWFKGKSIKFVKRIVNDKNSRIYEYLDFAIVNSIVNEHLSGISNRRLFIWSVLNFEYWLKAFIPA
jgi:asparagine synthase (glutamine-hydrolysing)